MKLEVRVVAVPERGARAESLAKRTGGHVILDEDHAGAFPNHLRALISATDGTHLVVLEDDAILCPDFADHVARLAHERPDHLLGLYVGRSHPQRVQEHIETAMTSGPEWLDDPRITDELRWAVGYVMPVKDIQAVLDRLSQGSQHAWVNTDRRIGAWHAAQGRLSYPFPSPVDHDDSLPSTTSQGRSMRVAWAHCKGEM